jgi:hypothetical protein
MSIVSPQKQRDWSLVICVGILQPASCMAYFHAVHVAAVSFKISLRTVRQVPLPSGCEFGPRHLKVGRGAIFAHAPMRQRIEAAVPSPLIFVDRDARTDRDRPDAGVAVIDVPAILIVGGAAAGEFGHGPIKARLWRARNAGTSLFG